MDRNSILIVEDEADIAELVRYNLEREGFKSDTVGSGEEALKALRERGYDLVVLDLMLPGIDGIEVCARIKKEYAQGPAVLMLTARSEETDIVRGLSAGADDYVPKPFSPRVLIARVRALLRRTVGKPVDETVVHASHGIRVDSTRYEVTADGVPIELSATEFGILEVLVKNPGWVFSRSKIIDAVKGADYPVTERSVDVHILGLRRKLGKHGTLIQTVRGIGYRFADSG